MLRGPSRRLAQLTDERTLKSAALEQVGANATEAKRNVELERRENTNRLLVETSLVKQKDAELGRLQAKLDKLLLSRVQDVRTLDKVRSASQKATSRTATRMPTPTSTSGVNMHANRLPNMKRNLLKCVLSWR